MSEHMEEVLEGIPILTGNEYESCIFKECCIKGVDLKDTVFQNCTFNNCEISNIKILNSKITDCIFNKCKLVGVEWSSLIHKFGFSNTFNECYMPYSVFVDMDILGSNFLKCNLTESYFEFVKAKKVSFNNCDFKDTQFLKCDFTEADFRNAQNYFFNIGENICKNAIFSKEDAVYLLQAFGVKLD